MRIYNHLFTGTFKREPKPVAGAVEYKTIKSRTVKSRKVKNKLY